MPAALLFRLGMTCKSTLKLGTLVTTEKGERFVVQFVILLSKLFKKLAGLRSCNLI